MSKAKPSTKTLNESLDDEKYGKILKVIEKIENTDDNIILIERLHCLFDTLHDFGKFSISYDTLCNIRDNPSKHNISKMIFSLLAKHCFKISNDNFSRDFSNLTTSVGGLTSNLTAKDLENFFLKYALTQAGTNVTKSISTDLNNAAGYNRIITSFDKYIDENTGCINLFVDTQKNVYKCIMKRGISENDIAVVMARESIYDAAPKLDSKQPLSFQFLGNNFFIESGQGKRTYSENESDITIELSGIKEVKGRNAVDFTLTKDSSNLPIKDCVLNSSSKHPNCITYVNKNINDFMKNLILINKLDLTDLSNFYTKYQYNEKINTPQKFANSMNEIILEFTKKRFGDFKQLELVEGVNNKSIKLQCKRWNTDNTGSFSEIAVNVTKLILVTIDRMLFARCIFKKVPAILDFGNNMYFYNPEKDLSAITGGTVSNTIPKSLSFKYEYPKVTKGGAHHSLDATDVKNMVNSIMDNPILFFDFFPFIVAADIISAAKTKTALMNRYNTVIASLNDNKYLKTYLQCQKPYLSYYENTGIIPCNNDKGTEQVNFFYFSDEFYCEYNNKNRTIIYGTSGRSSIDIKPENMEGMIQGYNDKNNVVLNFFLDNGIIEKEDTQLPVTKSYNMYFLSFGAIIFILSILYQLGIIKIPFFRGGFDKKKLIKVANSITIYSYLWVFKLYEMRICTDIEQLKIDYDDCNVGNSNTDYYIPTHKRLYILFDKLIKDYQKDEKDEKDEIYIGLLEKYLFENDYELYYRIQEIKRCVLGDSNYNIDFAEFDKFEELDIYKKTYDYFKDVLENVNTRNEEIQNKIVKYYENNEYDELYKYCKDNVKYNRYTFLNMYSDFYETIIPLFEQPIILKVIVDEIIKQNMINNDIKNSNVPSVFLNVNSVKSQGVKKNKKTQQKKNKKHIKKRTTKITKK
jgi:hypothetical protein